jgi:hypothetical protein
VFPPDHLVEGSQEGTPDYRNKIDGTPLQSTDKERKVNQDIKLTDGEIQKLKDGGQIPENMKITRRG